MKRYRRYFQVLVCLVSFFCFGNAALLSAQQTEAMKNKAFAAVAADPQAASQSASSPLEVVPALPVPRLIKFSGVAKDASGQARSGVVGLTLSVYKDKEGGAALWMETQNAELDEQGRYTVLLGATKNEGLPLELFIAGEPRWLGVQVNLPKEMEQPRVLLVSVPYALKAADADTLGGKPASLYLTTEQMGVGGATGKANGSAGAISQSVSGTGTANVVAKWLDNVGTLGNSQITDDGTNVNMTGNVGALAYKFTGNAAAPTDATATIFNQAFVGPVFSGLSFKVRTGAPVPADALSIDTSQNVSITGNASALAYKFTGNATPPTDATATIFNQAFVGPVFSGLSFKVRTGAPVPADALSIDQSQNVSLVGGNLVLNGAGKAIVFSDGTVQSTAGKGTITGVTAGTGLTGGGTAGGVNLAIDPAVVPQLGATTNTFTGNITAAAFTGAGATLNSLAGGAASLNSLALPNTTSASVGVITLGINPFLHNFGTNNTFVGASAGNMTMTSPGNNTAVGATALTANTTGKGQSAFGNAALAATTTGTQNSAFGSGALTVNTTGNQNAGFGNSALAANTSGNTNSAFGTGALLANTTANLNSAFGFEALAANTTGANNTAIGEGALFSLNGGQGNLALGALAGSSLTSTESNNIYIGNLGVAGESQAIRIGTNPTATFIAGISGRTSASGVAVFINTAGQLGTITSSRRFKNDIADMGGESDLLMKLRPVAFYYKPELDDTQTRQYGLVAEEVAQVAPQLVVFDKNGAPQTVRYHFVNAMLLNEVQKQRLLVEEQQKANERQQSTIDQQQKDIKELAARLAKLETLLAEKP